MKKLIFIARWSKDRKKTWSGIVYGLYNSLQKYYSISDIDIGCNKPTIINKIFHKIFGSDMNWSLIQRDRLYIEKKSKTGTPVFQFEEITENTNDSKTYMFIDCSIDYVKYMFDNDKSLLSKSNWPNCNKSSLMKRAKLQNEYMKNASGVFTLCRWLVDDLINRTGIPSDKVHYAGAGVNVDVHKIDISGKKRNKILFVGRDFERKGGFVVLKAFEKLKKKQSNVELYIAGPKNKPFKGDIDGCIYLGDCDREKLNELYNKCDIFCMPSYFEAFGIVFVEALTFGLPCIGRKCFDMPYVIQEGETGECISDDNPDILSNLMFKILNDEKYFTNVNAKRDFYIKEYSWDTVAKRIADIIQ